ncbi:hypothetical protein HOLleu_45173 [Holothuria leucospilota]|uniref:Uncharacterized protein n=1 Tax=Holothuria leucospilota TaxID=206669 RepID=A0A9Q0YA52_HOLLE|nr:hypothetical protein HOLleu_45173 [Holothuria leucospilota]
MMDILGKPATMAMVSTSNTALPFKRKRSRCLIDCVGNATGDLLPFKDVTKSKVISCAMEWAELNGNEGELAGEIIGKDGEVLPDVKFQEHGYHRHCYNRFTDVSKIARARTKKQNTGK